MAIDHVVNIRRKWQLSKVSRIPLKYLILICTKQMHFFRQHVYRIFIKASANLFKRCETSVWNISGYIMQYRCNKHGIYPNIKTLTTKNVLYVSMLFLLTQCLWYYSRSVRVSLMWYSDLNKFGYNWISSIVNRYNISAILEWFRQQVEISVNWK